MKLAVLVACSLSFVACKVKTYQPIFCDGGVEDGCPDAGMDASDDAAPTADAAPDAARDAGLDAARDASFDATIDSAIVDAAIDAAIPDATVCRNPADTVTAIESAPSALWPQITADSMGVAAVYSDGFKSALVRVGPTGARRTTDVSLAVPEVFGIAWAGDEYIIAVRIGQSIELRHVAVNGVIGSSKTIGTGFSVPGGLAYHAGSGDTAVMFRAAVDNSLRVMVVPLTGLANYTVLDTPAFNVNSQPGGAVMATTAAGAPARFVAAWATVVSGSETRVSVKPLSSNGNTIVVSTGAAAVRERVWIAPGSTTNTGIVTWRDQTFGDPYVAVVDTTGLIITTTVTPRIVFTRVGQDFPTRVAGGGAAGGGFDVLVDIAHGLSDRAVHRYTFDATGAPVSNARVATVCTGTNEENLPFAHTSTSRHATWDNGSDSVLVTF